MKKIIVALSGVLLLIFFTAGCGSNQIKAENEKLKTELADSQKELARSKQREMELQLAVKAEQTKCENDIKALSNGFNREIDDGQVSINKVKSGIAVNMADKLFFETGKADIQPSGKKVLKQFAENLKQMQDKIIRIDGHTDNAKIKENSELYKIYPTNWELAAARAINVTRYLTEKCGIDPVIVSASTYSYYQPQDTNSTKKGRANNRRIEIIVMNKQVVDIIKH